MPLIEHETYSRWIEKWLPYIVFGAHADPTANSRASSPRTTQITDLPGGSIVRADS